MKEPTNYTIMRICVALNMTMPKNFDFEELTKFAKAQYMSKHKNKTRQRNKTSCHCEEVTGATDEAIQPIDT